MGDLMTGCRTHFNVGCKANLHNQTMFADPPAQTPRKHSQTGKAQTPQTCANFANVCGVNALFQRRKSQSFPESANMRKHLGSHLAQTRNRVSRTRCVFAVGGRFSDARRYPAPWTTSRRKPEGAWTTLPVEREHQGLCDD